MLYEEADRLYQSSIVGGSVKDSILVVGNENRIHQNQYILPSEPQPPLFVGVPPMPPHFVGREALVEVLVERLVTTGRLPRGQAWGEGEELLTKERNKTS